MFMLINPVCLSALRKVFPTNEGATTLMQNSSGQASFGQVATHKVAVRGLSLGIPDGSCFGLLGPNGAGIILSKFEQHYYSVCQAWAVVYPVQLDF